MIKEELLKGKSTLIKNKQYLQTADYVEPFFKKMDALDAKYFIRAKIADQLSGTASSPDIVYNKVHIQAVLPGDYYWQNECYKTIGMVYALDTKIPVAKFYTADIDMQGNIYTFDSNCMKDQKIEDTTALDFSPIDKLLQINEKNMSDINPQMIKQLKETKFVNSRDEVTNKLGQWVKYALTAIYMQNDNIKVKLSTATAIDAYKSLILDTDADSYVPESKDITIFNVCRSFGEQIAKDKDIINNFEKTILVSRMLGL